MAEEMQENDLIAKGMEEETQEIESQIKAAMSSRADHFKEQSDSLTFEGVRRLLEKDLGLETYALDVHKGFVKQFLLECINVAADNDPSKKSGETGEKNASSTEGETAEPPETVESKKEKKEPSSADEEKIEGSPVLGLMTGQKTSKSETEETQGKENNAVPSESTIKKAIRKRASYFKAKSENITMAGVRRVLEEDLELDKNTLDPYKKFITEQLDEVLKSSQVSKPTIGVKKGSPKKNSHSRASRKASSEGSSESLESESDEEEEVKPKTKRGPKGKTQNSEDLRKRKRPVKETKMPSKKRSKTAETVSEDNSDAEDSGNVSDDDHSQSSSEKPVKKKEVTAPGYGKRVEHLKLIIKSCAMSVPPSVYKRVKQAPENKREAYLIKELEEILSKEGLSKNPSEKEIKDVRKKKERAKELEGIDTSNIVLSSRRRSTTSFIPPPKPKIPDESDSEDAEDTDNDDDDDDDDDDDEEEEVEDEDDDGGEEDDASQSEELNEENAEDSD